MSYILRMILDNDCCIAYTSIKRIDFTSNYVYISFEDGEEKIVGLNYPTTNIKRFKHFKLIIEED